MSSSIRFSTDGAPSADLQPELADVGRYGRMLIRRAVTRARADEQPTFRTIIGGHLGVPAQDLPVIEEHWPAYELVNVQAGLDAVLAEPGTEHEVVGITGYRHRGSFGISDLVSASHLEMQHGQRPGNVARISMPAGPSGETRECLRAAVVLITRRDERFALLMRAPDPDSDTNGVVIEIVGTAGGAPELGRTLRARALELNVYRGQVVSLGRDMFSRMGSFLRFHERPRVAQDELILPETTFDDIRRQVVGVARNSERLRAAGQHLKRGLLLYGPPGAGKTHTVRYLLGQLRTTTVVQLSGDTLGAIKEACSIARALQPAMIVVEDVDLIARHRDEYGGSTPLLFTLLNEMDGLAEDADVVFLLTTNRADLLEPALAQRPGRIDQAVHIDLPDRDGRRRLVELYRGDLELDLGRIDAVLDRTDGVTASFIKELLRRAAVAAAERTDVGALAVSADDLDAALADLLDTRNQMTRAVLGLRDAQTTEADDLDTDPD